MHIQDIPMQRYSSNYVRSSSLDISPKRSLNQRKKSPLRNPQSSPVRMQMNYRHSSSTHDIYQNSSPRRSFSHTVRSPLRNHQFSRQGMQLNSRRSHSADNNHKTNHNKRSFSRTFRSPLRTSNGESQSSYQHSSDIDEHAEEDEYEDDFSSLNDFKVIIS